MAYVYQVDAWGAHGGAGVTGAQYCTLGGVAKVNGANSELGVANEYICSRLALLLGLPVALGDMMATATGDLAYVSLRFGPSGHLPPPVIPAHLVADHPQVAAGIVAFDCWIANDDRHTQNLSYVRGGQPPVLFDHERALLGENRGNATNRVNARVNAPAPLGHCLAPLLTDGTLLTAWAARVRDVRDDVVRSIVSSAVNAGAITLAEGFYAAFFLQHRKVRLLDSLKAQMVHVTNWGLIP